MSFTEDIEAFRVWATNIGCPPDALPNEDALKSIFKSRQRELFIDLQKRVQPRQYVRETRENILIKKVEQMQDKVVPACGRSFLPKEMQTHLKMQELKKRKEKAEVCLEEAKKEFDALATSIKTKNIQSISAEHRKAQLESKYNLLQFKLESLSEAFIKEEQNKIKIQSTMPVKLNSKTASEAQATKAVEHALKELSQFYNICNNNNNDSQSMQEFKQALWQKLRQIFANVPNYLLFNAIIKLKEEQLQHIMKLNKTDNGDKHSNHTTSSISGKQPLNTFEVRLLKTKADLLGLVARYMNACNEVLLLEERFSKAYNLFVDELQRKVNNFNAVADATTTEELISDFIVQYNIRNYSRARNEFLVQQIENFRLDIETNAKQLENHEVLLSTIKQVYGDINTSINRIQYEMLQLTQIKEKILYSKNKLRNMFKDMQAIATQSNANAKTNFLTNKLKINNLSISLMGGADSFEMGNDSLFCSTKLDFDGNMSFMNNTLRRSFGAGGCNADGTLMPGSNIGAITANTAGVPKLPCHLLELNTFEEISFEKLSCMPRVCAYYLLPNPLIVESRELASTIQLAPGLLLTPFGALQEVRQRILWASAIAAHTNDLKFNLDAIIVNQQDFKQKLKKQHENISQLLDNIDGTAINTKQILQKAERIFKFILDNPMRHFIPSTKTYNNLSYMDYESEFILYYRMITVGSCSNKQ